MKRSERIYFSFAILFLLVIILFIPLRLLLFNENFYYSSFEKNNVYSKVNQTESKIILKNLLAFFKGDEELVYFEENEKSHLEDVKNLINKFFDELYFAFAGFLILIGFLYFANKKDFNEKLLKIFFLGGLISFSFVILFFLASLNFAITFQGFHEVFFSQGNFMFDQASLLITLFPEVFFKSFFIRMMLTSLLLSGIAMIPQLVYNRMKN
ncbi:DUF1461 domain-containing protein [Bacteroidota bacterium]